MSNNNDLAVSEQTTHLPIAIRRWKFVFIFSSETKEDPKTNKIYLHQTAYNQTISWDSGNPTPGIFGLNDYLTLLEGLIKVLDQRLDYCREGEKTEAFRRKLRVLDGVVETLHIFSAAFFPIVF